MTADEFWHKPPLLAKACREAYKLRVRHENETAWMQGAYIMNAVQAAISNTFGKKGGKKTKYLEKPFDLGLETQREKAIKAKQERDKIIASLSAWKMSWDLRQKSGEKQSQP